VKCAFNLNSPKHTLGKYRPCLKPLQALDQEALQRR